MNITYKCFNNNIKLPFISLILTLITFQSANCEIIREKPLSYVLKVSLDYNISVYNDAKVVTWPITLNSLNPIELNNLFEKNIKHTKVNGECVASDFNDRIICRLDTLVLITDQEVIHKKIQGFLYDKDGKEGFKGETGFFDRIFSKYPTITKKKIDGEEFDVVLIFPHTS